MKHIFICHDLQSPIGPSQFELEQAGYVVRLFQNCGDLVRAIAQCEPDLVLIDVLLQGKNGFEVCAGLDLRENDRFPVALLSGIYHRPVFRDTAMGLGVTEFIEGSLDEIDLLGTVSNILSQFEQRKSNKAA